MVDPAPPCIVCVAITGSLPTKTNNPAVPITIAEQVESSHEGFETGATIAHCHARTGLEDNVRLDRERLAPSNAALVRRVADLCARHHRPVAAWQDALRIFGLPYPPAS